MNALQKRRLAILEDTASHYNNKNRSQINGSSHDYCTYIPKDPEKSEGCAVGRLVKNKKLLAKLDERNGGMIADFIDLPKGIQTLGQEFLTSLQNLHDNNLNWDEKGLSVIGVSEVTYIKNRFKLN